MCLWRISHVSLTSAPWAAQFRSPKDPKDTGPVGSQRSKPSNCLGRCKILQLFNFSGIGRGLLGSCVAGIIPAPSIQFISSWHLTPSLIRSVKEIVYGEGTDFTDRRVDNSRFFPQWSVKVIRVTRISVALPTPSGKGLSHQLVLAKPNNQSDIIISDANTYSSTTTTTRALFLYYSNLNK